MMFLLTTTRVSLLIPLRLLDGMAQHVLELVAAPAVGEADDACGHLAGVEYGDITPGVEDDTDHVAIDVLVVSHAESDDVEAGAVRAVAVVLDLSHAYAEVRAVSVPHHQGEGVHLAPSARMAFRRRS